MTMYRMEVQASIMFNVEADTPEEAVKIANGWAEVNDSGLDFDVMITDTDQTRDREGRLYVFHTEIDKKYTPEVADKWEGGDA